MRYPPIGAIAIVSALAVGVVLRVSATAPATVRLWFDPAAFDRTPEDVTAALGGPLTPDDVQAIHRQARAELHRAFAGLHLRFVEEGRAFWRIVVVPSVVRRGVNGRAIQNAAGASYPFGPLGGGAYLSFTLKATLYAPPGASREQMVAAIGRGIGRSAVHELTHLALGPRAAHSDQVDSYE